MSAEAAVGIEAGASSIRRRASIDYLRVSVTDRCNYGCSYCIPRRRRRARGARRRAVVRGDRGAGAGVRRRWACAACASPAASRPCAATCRARAPAARDPGPRRHRAVDQRSPAGRAGGAAARRRRRPRQHQPRLARPRALPAHHAPGRPGARARRHRGGARRPASRRSSSTRSRSRGFNDDEFGRICAWAWERGLVPRFIEEMPMADGRAIVPGALLPAAEIRRRIAAAWPERARRRRRRRRGARRGPGALLPPGRRPTAATGRPRRFGIISPMTEHFCDTCNRLRLSTRARCTPASRTTTPSTCAGRCTRAAPTRSRARSAARWRENAPDTPSSSSGSAVRAKRWYKSADDRRRAAQATDRRPGTRIRGAAGARCAAFPASAWIRAAAPRWPRARSWAPTTCARRARGSTPSTPAASRWSSAASSRTRRSRRSPSTTTWTCSRPTATGARRRSS